MSIWSRLRGVEKLLSEINRGYVHNDYCKQTCSSVLLTCESCGCAVVKGEEVEGKHEVRERQHRIVPAYGLIWSSFEIEKYIHTPVYCKRCAGEKAKPKRSHHKK
jgi:hypothetical protein